MSREQLKAFLNDVRANSDLQDKLKAAKSSEEVVCIAKEHGHEFNSDYLNELSEAELESISGSAGTCAPGTNSWACTL